MKRVYIVVEGQTEQEFVNSIVSPYLNRHGILDTRPILIRTSRLGKGGLTKYIHLQRTIKYLLKSQRTDFIVTTFIDYFRLPISIPKYEEYSGILDERERIKALEAAIDEDIADKRFFSYIQRHEFEALLFSDNSGFEYYFNEKEYRKTAEIISSFNNPEDINSSPDGAPSKRLLAIKHDYNKVLEGNLIALEIGIDAILVRCPGFASWIQAIIEH